LEISAEKMKCVFLSHHPNAGQNHDVDVLTDTSEDVANFKSLGVTITNCMFACSFIWVWSLVSDHKGRTWIED
jgi:hypothetical protein